MPALSKIAVAAVALVGGASAGNITSTAYDGAGCTTPNADDIPRVYEWTSGECVSCTGYHCEWPFFPQDFIDDIFRPNGADPSYAKVTCANGVTTIEHFSDAECTAANKVSNEAITAAYSAVVAQSYAEVPLLFPQNGTADLRACVTATLNAMSGVDISGSHCDTWMLWSLDEVRVLSLPRMRVRCIV